MKIWKLFGETGISLNRLILVFSKRGHPGKNRTDLEVPLWISCMPYYPGMKDFSKVSGRLKGTPPYPGMKVFSKVAGRKGPAEGPPLKF